MKRDENKSRVMPIRWLALLLTNNFAGCAAFDHQTLENEPHAVIHVVNENTSSFDYWTVARIDGLPVRFRKVFRVRPGEHEIVVRVSETISDRYTGLSAGAPLSDNRPSLNVDSSGRMTATEGSPFGEVTQMANLNVESHQVSYHTNKITVEAGWTYELDGYRLTKMQPGS